MFDPTLSFVLLPGCQPARQGQAPPAGVFFSVAWPNITQATSDTMGVAFFFFFFSAHFRPLLVLAPMVKPQVSLVENVGINYAYPNPPVLVFLIPSSPHESR